MNVKDIERASILLRDVLNVVPVSYSRTFSEMCGAELFLKCENLQKTGSFKVRGAYNKIYNLQKNENAKAVVASSAGNHAQGVAYASKVLGMSATIVMPIGTPIAKISATEGYGAKVVLHGSCYDEAYARAVEIQKESNAAFVHPFDDEDVICGQATVALEMFRDIPTVDTIIVPAGGGGLLSGIAYYVKQINPRIRVIGVQSEGANAIFSSFQGKTFLSSITSKTIADGIAVKTPGDITIKYINKYVDDIVTVSDSEIAASILLLLERTKMVVEPAGAASLAAAINKKIDLVGKRAVCVLSGGNIDVSFIHKIVEKGLITRGRKMKFKTVMTDAPGSLKHLAEIVCDSGANITLVQHDRMNTDLGLNDAILHVVCEVSGFAHSEKLVENLEKGGYSVVLEL